jgi:hypothetical protein
LAFETFPSILFLATPSNSLAFMVTQKVRRGGLLQTKA